MKVLGNLPIAKRADSNIPFGSAIQNETDAVVGTPVVDDVLQDILSNLYKVLQLTGINPTNAFDGESTQYQIIDAMRKLPNLLNDTEQVLTIEGSVWQVNFDFSYLPNKYFFIARATEDYDNGADYTIIGNGDGEETYTFVSTGFKASESILIVLDQSNARAYSLSALSEAPTEIYTSLGTPVAYNSSNKMWYQEGGILMSDAPSSDNLEQVIQTEEEDSTVILQDMFIVNGYVLCFCLVPSTNNYFFRQFDLTDLSSSSAVSISGTAFGTSEDFNPYVYVGFNGATAVYITNGTNTLSEDNSISSLVYDANAKTLTSISNYNIESSFVKTNNAFIHGGSILTFVDGILSNYNLTSGTKIDLGNYVGASGQLISFNGNIYFCTGEVCTKWF